MMIKKCIVITILWVISLAALGADLKSFSSEYQTATFFLDNETKVDLQLVNQQTVAVNYHINSQPVPPPLDLIQSDKPISWNMKEQEDTVYLQSGDFEVVVKKRPFSLQYWYKGELKTQEESGAFAHRTVRGFRFALQPDEKLMGGGERVMGMDRRGQRMPLYNRAHYGYGTESNQMYYSLPAVLSDHNYAIAFDNTASGLLDIGNAEHDVLQFEAVGGRLRYIISVGNSIADVSQQLIAALGKQPLPPRWALGNFASRFGYHTEKETRDIVNAYARHNIPLDAVVLDLYWFGKDIKGHMGNLDWDRDAFPNPEKMIADFAADNIKTVVITEPFILDTSSKFEDAVTAQALATSVTGEPKMFNFYFGHTGLIDVFDKSAQDWFWQFYSNLMEQGVAGWWGDLGEPEVHPADTLHNWDDQLFTADEIHNIYGHKWAKMVYQQTLQYQPEKRPFVLMRAGYLGSQRYGMLPWTGDVSRSWEGFKPQVELALQMGMFGLGYIHSDLGGFAGGESFDKELYLRWLQFGVFSPVFRPHAQEHIPPEPVMHSQDVIDAAKTLIDLRYRLLPYNYTLSFENSLHGKPLMRPLSYHYDQQKWFDNKDSYLWGGAFLVSPVTQAAQSDWKVDLPQGRWYDFWSSEAFEGNQIINYQLTENTFPVLVNAGAFVPMVDAASRTEKVDWSNLQIHYWYSEKQSDYTYYEDSGNDPSSLQDKQYVTMVFSAQSSDNQLKLVIKSEGDYTGAPTSRELKWVIHGLTSKPSRIELADGTVLNQDQFSARGVDWRKSKSELFIPVSIEKRSLDSLVIHF